MGELDRLGADRADVRQLQSLLVELKIERGKYQGKNNSPSAMRT